MRDACERALTAGGLHVMGAPAAGWLSHACTACTELEGAAGNMALTAVQQQACMGPAHVPHPSSCPRATRPLALPRSHPQKAASCGPFTAASSCPCWKPSQQRSRRSECGVCGRASWRCLWLTAPTRWRPMRSGSVRSPVSGWWEGGVRCGSPEQQCQQGRLQVLGQLACAGLICLPHVAARLAAPSPHPVLNRCACRLPRLAAAGALEAVV